MALKAALEFFCTNEPASVQSLLCHVRCYVEPALVPIDCYRIIKAGKDLEDHLVQLSTCPLPGCFLCSATCVPLSTSVWNCAKPLHGHSASNWTQVWGLCDGRPACWIVAAQTLHLRGPFKHKHFANAVVVSEAMQCASHTSIVLLSPT